jgi:hypothetical protein
MPATPQNEDLPEKDDLLAAEDGAKRTVFFSPRPARSKAAVFALGGRAGVLAEMDAPIIVPLVPKEGQREQRYHYEYLLRSILFALVDNGAREYLFGVGFYCLRDAGALEFFHGVMGKTLALLLKHETDRIAECYDAIGLVICARIVEHFQLQLQNRGLPCLDFFFTQLQVQLVPRAAAIAAMHATSVRTVDPSRLSHLDTRPHFIVRRYAEFSGAMLLLLDGHPDLDEISPGMLALRQEVENFILRVAAEFPQRKDQLVFLINNYDLMLSIYGEKGASGDDFGALLEVRSKFGLAYECAFCPPSIILTPLSLVI